MGSLCVFYHVKTPVVPRADRQNENRPNKRVFRVKKNGQRKCLIPPSLRLTNSQLQREDAV